MLATAGCHPQAKSTPAQKQAAAHAQHQLTADQREKNLESFDYVYSTNKEKHWNQELVGESWDAAHSELRPKVEHAKTMGEARQAMMELIERLKQSHFAIIPR